MTQESDRTPRLLRRTAPAAGGGFRTPALRFDQGETQAAEYPAPTEGAALGNFASWRRWLLVPLCTAIGAAAGFPRSATPVTTNAPAKYTSSALVKFESRGDGSDVRALAVPREYVALLRSELDQLAEPEDCVRAAHSEALRHALPWLGEQNLDDPQVRRVVRERLGKCVKGYVLPGSQLVRIEAITEDRAAAVAICNTFADVLVAQCRAHFPTTAANPANDVQSELAECDKAVASLQAQKLKLLERSDATDVEQQQSALTAQVEHYTSLRLKLETTRVESAERLARLSEPAADGIVEKFLRLKQQRFEEQKTADKVYREALAEQLACEKDYATERGSGKTEKHRDVILAADRLHRAQNAVAQRASELSAQVDSGIIAEKDAAISAAKAQSSESVRAIDQQISDIDRKLTSLDEKSKQLTEQRKKQQEVKLMIEQVDSDLQREKRRHDQLDAQQIDALAHTKPPVTFDIAVSRRATPESVVELSGTSAPPPFVERIGKISIPWLAGGFGVGLFLAFASAGVSLPRRKAPQGEPFLGGPILGSIPIATPPGAPASKRKIIQQGVADAFRNLRNNLMTRLPAPDSDMPHTLCITSPHRGDGRSCVAVGLAISLAKGGRRVLLVDADLRAPTLHDLFGVDRSPGLCELIEGKSEPQEALIATETSLVTLLRAGTPGVDAGHLLGWGDLTSYLQSLGRRHDHVIIDLGPLLETPDSHNLLSNSDATLLVFTPATDPSEVEQSVTLLHDRDAYLIGMVRNRT